MQMYKNYSIRHIAIQEVKLLPDFCGMARNGLFIELDYN